MCADIYSVVRQQIIFEERAQRSYLYFVFGHQKRRLYFDWVKINGHVPEIPIPKVGKRLLVPYYYHGQHRTKVIRRVSEPREVYFKSYAEVFSLEITMEEHIATHSSVWREGIKEKMALLTKYKTQYGADTTDDDSWDQCMILEDYSTDLLSEHAYYATTYLQSHIRIGLMMKPCVLTEVEDVPFISSPIDNAIES